jgi:hypothetical protein
MAAAAAAAGMAAAGLSPPPPSPPPAPVASFRLEVDELHGCETATDVPIKFVLPEGFTLGVDGRACFDIFRAPLGVTTDTGQLYHSRTDGMHTCPPTCLPARPPARPPHDERPMLSTTGTQTACTLSHYHAHSAPQRCGVCVRARARVCAYTTLLFARHGTAWHGRDCLCRVGLLLEDANSDCLGHTARFLPCAWYPLHHGCTHTHTRTHARTWTRTHTHARARLRV